ncbi:uncharacterized protein LOC119172815 [Rhipicephalus microplus]|uniref:uncharacterized protein LOC119172815 n=1 Tax=Rhipicephalus microplus TaxID=6941 RepID=UPI003F6D59CA
MFVLPLVLLATTRIQAQDTSAILSGILGSLTSTSKARGCPGECVHAITALLCDQVVDEIQCGASYLRCCVPKEFSLGGTAVETSAPLAEDEMAPATSPATAVDEDSNATVPTPLPPVTPAVEAPPQQQQQRLSSTPPPLPPPTQVPTQRDVCTGVCVGNGLSQYCHRVLSSPSCGPDAVCCTSADGPPQAEQPQDGVLQQQQQQHQQPDHSPSHDAVQEAKLPECPGSCVSPLLSILCDHVSPVHSCPTGGSCCISAAATTTEPPIPACDGRCLPPFLSGVCQKPAQLLLRTTTCPSGTICCSQPERGQRPGNGFFAQQQGVPMRQQRPAVQQQRPFGAIIPQERPYQNHPQAHDQLNAVIPVDQAMIDQIALDGGDRVHRRPQHEHVAPPQQGRPDGTRREPSQQPPQGPPQGGLRPVKQGLGPPKRLRPSQHHPPGSMQRPGPRPPSPSSMDFQGDNQQGPPQIGLANDASNQPILRPLRPSSSEERPGGGESNALAAAPHLQHQQQQQHQHHQHQRAPPCPGNCISSYLRFACFGENAIHPRLLCPQEGLVCCANVAQVQRMAEEAAAASPTVNEDQLRPDNPPPPPSPPSEPPPRAALNPDPGSRPQLSPPRQVARPEAQQPPEIQQRPKPVATAPPRKMLQQPSFLLQDAEIATALPSSTTRAPSVAKGRRPPRPSTCGVKGGGSGSAPDRRHAARITGGKDSVPGEWCWQAALINSQNQYLCGGALIGTQWVLTAAHCVTSLVRNGEPVFVRVGDHDLGSERAHPGAQTRRVATTYIHHNHNGQTLDNDIALLKLQGAVQLNPRTCLVCLPARGAAPTPGDRCTVTGYGYLGEGGPIALRVREAVLPVVEDRDCTAKINAVTEKQFLMPASSYCAGGEKGDDACQGDGGGPMVCLVDGFYELAGLVSWGFGCGRPDVPGVYVKVSAFIGWINQIISVNNL